MKLSIITINWNNADGLQKTIQSIVSQTYKDFEYVIIDGCSKDRSVEIIQHFAKQFPINWVSEPDKGIYNAMNKGITRASGEYLHFLNSGDILFDNQVVEKMVSQLAANNQPDILIGKLHKHLIDGTLFPNPINRNFSFLRFYSNSINHPATYIKKELFLKYGLYDESLKIVSDWKWFMQAIIFGGEKPVYVDMNVTLFDMTGISESVESKEKIQEERQKVLKKLIPEVYLRDYERYSNEIYMMRRINRHPWVFKLVWFVERCLFKLEKRQNKKKSIQSWD